MSERFPLVYLFPLRLLCGLILTIEGWQKLQGGWLHGTALLSTLEKWMGTDKPYAFFMPVLRSAAAHPKIFGSLITLGELVVGVSLLVGVVTRTSSALGAIMLFSIAFGAGQGLAPPGNALLLGSILVLFVLAPPGRVLGIDTLLRGRLPRWMV